MKKLVLFLTAILLCISLTSSLEISAEYDTNIIVKDLENSIDLTLTITNAPEGTYNLYTLADVSIRPSETFEITESTSEKKFTLAPTENLDNVKGHYFFSYILNHRGVEKIEEKMLINLVNLEDIIEISSDSIDPASDKVSFYIRNKESVRLENITAEFSSILFDTEQKFTLEPKEKLEIDVDVDENKLKKTKAGIYIIEGVFQTKNGERKINGNLYLGEKKGITSTEDKSGILIQTETITRVNVGNVLESTEVEISKNIFSRFFTTFNIEPTLTERKGFTVKYTWIKERLNPAEAYVIKARTNYVLPFFVIVIAVLAIFGFLRLSQTKLEIKKSVSHVKTKGEEFALKITLKLKAKKNLENVTLIDRVPAIVKIYKKFGIIKPDKIDAENRRIHWNIGNLGAGEERVFNYIVYSKVGFVGKFVLPRALGIFEKDKKLHEVDSNNVFFMSDQVRGK